MRDMTISLRDGGGGVRDFILLDFFNYLTAQGSFHGTA